MKKGKLIVLIFVLAILVAAGIFFVKRFMKKDDGEDGRLVYVESVAMISGHGTGISNRYMGIVESQETKKVDKDDSKKVKEIFVSVGDKVKEGDQLFSYDTDDMQLDLQEMELELDNIKNSIASDYERIEDLVKLRDNAPEDDKLGYTSQINSISADIKQEEYSLSTKELEIERQKESINSAVVFSPMSGTVKKINKDSSNGGYGYNEDTSFITIMADGDFRVKGTISENNIYDITTGMPVILRSRVDENTTWTGTVGKIDLEPQQSGNSDYYYGGGSSGESASKYTFYVKLDSFDGLMLGQHLYIELDYGQGEVKEGINIPSYYFVIEGSDYYLWTRDNNKKIEKRKVSVGDYDEMLDTYQVLDGVKDEDYIAFPDENIKEGCKTTTNYEDIIDQMDYDDNGSNDDGMYDNDMYDGQMNDDGMVDDSYYDNGQDGIMMPDGSISYDIPEGSDQDSVIYDGADVPVEGADTPSDGSDVPGDGDDTPDKDTDGSDGKDGGE